MSEEVTNEVKTIIVQNEITMHSNTMYQLGLRFRVNKKLGATDEELKPLTDEMTKHEQILDLLREELEKVSPV